MALYMEKEAEKKALIKSMNEDPAIVVMGEGIIYKRMMYELATDLQNEFGSERVLDVPISETAICGIAGGLAMNGYRVLYMHDRADFLFLTMDQIINHATKMSYMSAGQVSIPIVLWSIINWGGGGAAQHSQSVQGIFMQVPNISIVMPSCSEDAYGLLRAALKSDSPVLFLEHRRCLESVPDVNVFDDNMTLGKARVRVEGEDVTIIAVSVMVIESIEAGKMLSQKGIKAEVIDLRTVKPFDRDLIIESVQKTRRVVIADTSWETGSIAKEISDFVYRKMFNRLLSPIEIVACPDVPAPAAKELEDCFYPDRSTICDAVENLFKY